MPSKDFFYALMVWFLLAELPLYFGVLTWLFWGTWMQYVLVSSDALLGLLFLIIFRLVAKETARCSAMIK